MLTLALTGGIGSGKSLVASIWKSLGAHVIDADHVAREIVEPGTPALEQIIERWGRDVIGSDGRLDRQALATIVFQHAPERAMLNSITHPAVAEEAKSQLRAIRENEPNAVVVYDVPLLVGQAGQFAMTANVTVNADELIRIARLKDTRGMSGEDARARINSQPTDVERTAIADVVIINEGDEADLRADLEEIWQAWIVPFNSRLTTGKFDEVEIPDSEAVVYRDALGLQIERLESLGIEVSNDDGVLVIDGPTDQLWQAGWVESGGIWRHANPALDLTAKLA